MAFDFVQINKYLSKIILFLFNDCLRNNVYWKYYFLETSRHFEVRFAATLSIPMELSTNVSVL